MAANATSAVAVFPGYLANAAGFRREWQVVDRGLLLQTTRAALFSAVATFAESSQLSSTAQQEVA